MPETKVRQWHTWLTANRVTLMEVTVKLLFDALTVLLFTLLIGGMVSQKSVDIGVMLIILALAVVNYFLAAIVAKFIRHWELSKGNFLVRGGIALIIVYLSTTLGLAGQEAVYQITALVGLGWLWLRAEYYRIEDAPYKTTRDYVFALMAAATLLCFLPWVYKGPMVLPILTVIYPVFLVLGIFYLGLVNVYHVFMRHHDNQLNLQRNVRRIRRTALLYGFLAVALVQVVAYLLVDLGLFKWLVELLSNLAFLFYPLIRALMFLMSQAADGMGLGSAKGEGKAEEAGNSEVIKELQKYQNQSAEWMEPLINGLLIVLFIAVLLWSFKRMNRERMTQNTNDDSEIKEFIFDEAFKPKGRGQRQRLLLKDPVRLKYFHWLQFWAKQGKRMRTDETPRRFLERLEREGITGKTTALQERLSVFRLLTPLYERVRYGNKSISDQEAQWLREVDDKPKG